MIKELINIIHSPSRIERKEKGKFKNVFYSVLLYALIFACYVVVLKYLDNWIELPDHKSYSFVRDHSWYLVLILGVIIVPIVEELAFRLFLQFSPFNLSLSFSLLSYFALSIITRSGFYKLDDWLLLKLLFFTSIFCISYFVLLREKNIEKLRPVFKKYFSYIFYFSILFFALLHARNIDEYSIKNILLIPVLVFPQFILAVLTSYNRIRSGLVYSIILHSIINFIPLSLMIIALK